MPKSPKPRRDEHLLLDVGRDEAEEGEWQVGICRGTDMPDGEVIDDGAQ
jgi:hypothetical protein